MYLDYLIHECAISFREKRFLIDLISEFANVLRILEKRLLNLVQR